MNAKRMIFFFIALSLFFLSPFTPAVATDIYKFERMWPIQQQLWYFNWPVGVCIDREGNVFILNTEGATVYKLTRDGRLITKWGSMGSGDSQFTVPGGIVVDGDGYVYVADTANGRIQKFTSNGQFVKKWGSYGSGNGQFKMPDNIPGGIAVDGDGYVYVADSGNNRIQKFTSDGVFVRTWGTIGTGNGQFNYPVGITVDRYGYVYVADKGNHRIQAFTPLGQLVQVVGSKGSGNGQFNEPLGCILDSGDNIYVADSKNNRIQKFDWDGNFVMAWGSAGFDDNKFGQPYGISVDKNDYIYVTDLVNNRIQQFTSNGQFLTAWDSAGTGNGQFNQPTGVVMDGESYIYVADSQNFRIQKFTLNGQFLKAWGSLGTGNGQFGLINGLALDGKGNIYATDNHPTKNRIQKFTTDGQFVAAWGDSGTGNGQFDAPFGITVDKDDFVYVTDAKNNRIQKFTSTGQFITKWGSLGTGNGQFDWPRAIAVDGDSNVYVADTANGRIQKFNASGTYITQWGGPGTGDGQFYGPIGIMIDSNNFIYVIDVYNNNVQKFTSNGTFIEKWGSAGFGPGLLSGPTSMASNGSIYVIADTSNNRIQVYRKTTQSSRGKAIVVAGGGAYPGNDLWDATQVSANFAYRALTYQGFTKENIHYLSSATIDVDGDGLSEVSGDATNANLQNAITTWAKGADDVVVYLVDHGGVDSFRMSGNETLSVSQLSTWLDTLQNNITGKVIVIYDACESGSFVNDLKPPAGKQRIIIASTSPQEKAYFLTQGSISFSSYFWTHVFNGLDVKNAFDLTKDAMQHTTPYQNPLLDDNGNGIPNETGTGGDGTLAQNTFIGTGTNSEGSAPVIGEVSAPQTITDKNSALLYASNVTDADGVARVWAVIRPPDYRQGDSTNAVQDLPSIDLLPDGNNLYKATYNSFAIPGTYQIAIYALDRVGNTSIPKITTVSVNNPLRRRVIIVAGGSPSDDLWPAIERNVKLAYNALSYQGYVDDDLYLLSPASISGVSKLPLLPTKNNFNDAVTRWASNNTEDLAVYLIGKGDNGTFRISDSETLSATELNSWLNSLQAVISVTVTVIYDGPMSGSFLPALTPPAGKHRILISSTGTNQPAYFLSSGDISFSQFFWNRVMNGANLRDCFLQAKRAMAYLSSDQANAPLLDDNGNGIGNEKSDGQIAMNYTLGFGIMMAADDPLIGSVSPPQTLTGTPSALLWAKDVTTTGTIAKVWAVITPPGTGQTPNVPVTDLPTIDLHYNATTNRYEGTFYRFNTQGKYTVAIYASDGEGVFSLPSTTDVTQTTTLDLYEDDNSPAHASVIVLNDILPQTHNFHAQGDEDWVKFYALADEIYEVKTSNAGANADVILELYDSNGTKKLVGPVDDTWGGEEELFSWKAPKTGIYYVRVRNYDSVYGANTNYDLKVYRPISPDIIGTLRGIVVSDYDLSRISGAMVQASLGSALSQDGSFILRVEAGSVNVSVNAEGFNSTTVQNIVVQAGRETPVTIRMVPPMPGDIDGSRRVNLADAILALQVISRMNPAATVFKDAAVNGDGKIGMAEVIYILQKVAGMR